MKRHILCIDLKCFFASVECIDRNVDPFCYPLVVANKKQKGAMTLAVSPYLKEKGVKGRTRIYEIPKNLSYEIVNPRMGLYIQKSKEVIQIYLDFVSSKDLHIYSIDECFLDVTSYLSFYKKTDFELGKEILRTIKERTGLSAVCGIGPNMLLAKLSMDIEAKHQKSGIAKWDESDIKEKLWPIFPLSTMWGIGPRMEKKLNQLHIYTIQDLACYDVKKLKQKFGVIGYELWQHANGVDSSIIEDFRYNPKEKSIHNSQILFKDYHKKNILLIIREMVEVLVMRLFKENLETSLVHLGIQYSKNIGGGFSHSTKIPACDSIKEIYFTCVYLFDLYYDGISPIRKVSICLSKLAKKEGYQIRLFETLETHQKEENLLQTIYEVQNKFGKNSIHYASSLLKDSTIIERSKKIGGHYE